MMSAVLRESTERDAVCGMRLPVEYYEKTKNWRFKGVYYRQPHDFFTAGRRDFERVWVMDSVNMHDEVTQRHFEPALQKMRALGYRLTGKPISFGGPDALTKVYVYERVGASDG